MLRVHGHQVLHVDQQKSASGGPETISAMADGFRALLGRLGDATLRQIALWKLDGHTNAEIARLLGRSEATVERKLKLIRELWDAE